MGEVKEEGREGSIFQTNAKKHSLSPRNAGYAIKKRYSKCYNKYFDRYCRRPLDFLLFSLGTNTEAVLYNTIL